MSKLVRAAVQADPSRRQALRDAPIPAGWEALVARELRPFTRLTLTQQARLLGDLKVFAGEKKFVGLDGFEIDERMRVLISAHAALLVLGLDVARFDHILSVEVRAETLVEPDGTRFAGRYRHGMAGTAPIGIVEVAWDQVTAGMQHDEGYNVVLHELAHALDHSDGRFDALIEHPKYAAWQEALRGLRLGRWFDVAAPRIADVEGPELFAAATELYFEHPRRILQIDPDLYAALRDFYQVDALPFAI